MSDIKYLFMYLFIYLFIVMLCCDQVHAEDVYDIPTKCEYRREQIKIIEAQLADRIYNTWRETGDKPSAKLKDLAAYTASYILLDNGITCRRRKY